MRYTPDRCHALITGASSGFGAEFARQLAPHAASLALVARRETELNTLAAELRTRHPELTVHCFPCDLASEAARVGLAASCQATGFRPSLLINNAGLGDYGEFAAGEWARTRQMVEVNVSALVHLTYLFLPGIRAAAATGLPGGVLNVSSLAGELPIPDFSVYAASKAFVSRFTEALRMEERGHGVTVSALCPGPVRTGFGEIAERAGERTPKPGFAYQTIPHVVRTGLRALEKGQAKAFPGAVVWWTARLVNLLPLPALRVILSRRPRKSKTIN